MVGGSRNDGDVSFFVDSVPSHARRRRRQPTGTALQADPVRRAEVVRWAGRCTGLAPEALAQKSNTITPPSIVPVNSINQRASGLTDGFAPSTLSYRHHPPLPSLPIVARSCGNSCSVGVTSRREIKRRLATAQQSEMIDDASLPHPRTVAESACARLDLVHWSNCGPELGVGRLKLV